MTWILPVRPPVASDEMLRRLLHQQEHPVTLDGCSDAQLETERQRRQERRPGDQEARGLRVHRDKEGTVIAEVCHCTAHDQMHVHLPEAKELCHCGTEDLRGENLLLNPFVLEGRHLHTAERCGRVASFSLPRPGEKWHAVWANPQEVG